MGLFGIASLIAVLTVGSVWIGPRLRPWAVGFVAAGTMLIILFFLTGPLAHVPQAGLAAVTGEHYAGGHWLGSFATYLVTRRGLSADEAASVAAVVDE